MTGPPPPGGHPPQSDLLTGRAVFTDAYAVLPRGTMRDITASHLPHWRNARLWVLARPMTGFAETFSQYLMEVGPDGGTERPEGEPGVQSALYVTDGAGTLEVDGDRHDLAPGAFAYLAPSTRWGLAARRGPLRFHWIRKRYAAADGIAVPSSFVVPPGTRMPQDMPDTGDAWTTTRFMDPDDMGFDMHVTIVALSPGAVIPFLETHVMEHGLFVLQGKGVYRLNGDWVEVEAGDFMWLRAFCPQACYAGGPEPFRYLLYKDVNRHAAFWP